MSIEVKTETPTDDSIRLLVLAQRPKDFVVVTRFLAKRGWQVEVATDMKQAFALLTKLKPQWALVSVDHPLLNPKKVMALLEQTFGVTPIAFCENLDGNITSKLSQMTGHSINGKVSGPSIQMKIHSILRQANATGDSYSNSSLSRSSNNMIANDGGNITVSSSHKGGGSEVIIQEGVRGTMMQNAVSSGAQPFSSPSQGPGGSSGPQTAAATNTGSGNYSGRNGPGGNTAANTRDNLAAGPHPLSSTNANDRAINARTLAPTPFTPRSRSPLAPKLNPSQQAYADLIERTLGEFSVAPSNTEFERVSQVTELTILILSQGETTGYLLVAMPPGRMSQSSLIQTLQSRLQAEFFKDEQALTSCPSGSVAIQIPNFVEWSIDQSTFLQNASMGTYEVILVFFEATKFQALLPLIQAAKKPALLEIQVDDIQSMFPVPHDVLLYLPENDRHIRLIGKNGSLSVAQKARLQDHNIKTLYIAKNDLEKFQVHYAHRNIVNLKKTTDAA